ncbi:MAG: hypothetical protein RL488_582 [Actinomycetota bacterium]
MPTQQIRYGRLALLALAVVATYATLIFTGFNGVGMPMGDLNLAYQQWVNSNVAFGLSSDWVYPWVALLPMSLANTISPGALIWPWLIGSGIITLVTALTIAYRARSAKAYLAMYFWLAALLMLGPVSISRLDAISVVLAVVAVFALSQGREASAAIWLSVATWVKVWPIAALSAIFVASKRRLNTLTVILCANVAILLIGFVLGADSSIFSFLSGQTGRGIQIEAPIAAFWLWPAVLGDQAFGIHYSSTMMTFEVFGANSEIFANLMSLVQFGALAITFGLGYFAMRKGAKSTDVFFWVLATGVLDLIVFNKVGSPQYMAWLVVPVIYGIFVGVSRIQWIAVGVLVLSALTWLIYPVLYSGLLLSGFGETLVLTTRNLALVAALVYANLRLQKLGK